MQLPSAYRRFQSFLLGSLIVGSILANSAFADFKPDYQISGFATLGLVTNNNADLAFRRDVTQSDGSSDGSVEWKTDSLVGIQWQGRWSPKFDATVQLVAKDRHDNKLENAVEWAFLRYRPIDGLDIRGGRLGGDVFMLSEYRQVGYALPWVRSPHEFYGPLSLYYYDGADITKRFDLAKGTLNVRVFYGTTSEKYPGNFRDDDGIKLDFSPGGISFNLEMLDWRFRYTYSHVSLNNNMVEPLSQALLSAAPIWPEAAEIAEDFNTKGKSMTYHALGAAFDNGVWVIQTEAATLNSDAALAPNSKHFYISVGRRIGAYTVYGLRGIARPDEDSTVYTAPTGYPSPFAEQLAMLEGAVNASVAGTFQRQNSFSAGVRWDFRPKMALKLQADYFDIDRSSTSLWVRDSSTHISEDQTATVISLALDVLF